MLGIGKDIKRSGGFHRNSESQLFEPFHHEFAALVVNLHHALNIPGGFGKGCNTGSLHHGIGRDEKILVQFLKRANERLRCDKIAEPEPGHGKKL